MNALPTFPKRLLPTKHLGPVGQLATRDDWVLRGLILLIALWLFISVVLPLFQIIWRSLHDQQNRFIGLDNYVTYFQTAGLSSSLFNSLFVSITTTFIAVTLGFLYAYGITRTAMAGKRFFQAVALLPLYAPSLITAIALIYLFGNQGIVTTGFFGYFRNNWGIDLSANIGLYGPVGIIIGEVVYCFPQAVLILTVALLVADARLYEASQSLRASSLRTFISVTIPHVKYGLASALFVCFTLAFTDFGVPKVVGANYNVLATDIYKQVIGQQNFAMGATVSVMLLLPTVLAVLINRFYLGRQVALLSSRAVPLQPRPNPTLDRTFFAICSLLAFCIIAIFGAAIFASLVNVWPYNLSLTLRHYTFQGVGGGGYTAFWNSVRLAAYTSVFGTIVVFLSAYLVEKTERMKLGRGLVHFLSMLPIALPGLVLGLAYIFFFNRPYWQVGAYYVANPFNSLYGTMAILVISNIIHFYTVGYLTAATALKQMDAEFEAISRAMGVPFHETLRRVTLPICLPALLEIGIYYFVNGMATVSAVIFLYSPALRLASVAVVNMDDAGDIAPAAAMSCLILGANIVVRLAYGLLTWSVQRRTQAWRAR